MQRLARSHWVPTQGRLEGRFVPSSSLVSISASQANARSGRFTSSDPAILSQVSTTWSALSTGYPCPLTLSSTAYVHYAAVKEYTKTQLTLRPQRPRQVPRVTESDAHVRISHKDGTCTRRSCAARRACSCGLGYPTQEVGLSGALFLCAFSGAFRGVLCALRCGRLGSSLVGLCFLVGACSAPFPGWLVVGRSSWSACRAVLLLCFLLACGLLCVLLAALAGDPFV